LAGLVVITSKWWQSAPHVDSPLGRPIVRAAWSTAAIVYLQLILGAITRHVPLSAAPGIFRAALLCHLLLAVALTGYVLMLAVRTMSLPSDAKGLRTISWLSSALVMAQLLLVVAT